ncbi:MAG: DUF3810 domain-containing protein [Bacteroidota bacterium]
MKHTLSKIDRRWIWIVLAGGIILSRMLLAGRPDLIEQYYSRGLFPWIRLLLDWTIALLPFPFLYLIILLLLAGIVRLVFLWRRPNQKPVLQRFMSFLLSLLCAVGLIVGSFLLLWGFNYSRIPFEDQVQIDPRALSKAELKTELELLTTSLITTRQAISDVDTNALDASYIEADLRQAIHDLVIENVQSLGYPTPGHPVCRFLYPKGSLLRISTAGFYLPFTGECHVDPGLHPIQLPFVIAHELHHAYGFTDEGTCNFLAYLACIRSKDPFIRYCGQFGYWNYLRSNFRVGQKEAYRDYWNQLPRGLRADRIAVSEQMQKYPDILPDVRDLIYGSYLKAQGISEGLQNYSRIILLAHAWRQKQQKAQKNPR